MISIEIKQSDLKKMKERFGVGYEKKLVEHVDKIVSFAENQMGRQVRADVYSYKPKTNSYRRTGNLLGGRSSSVNSPAPHVERLSKTSAKVTADPRLKGAKFNYAPIVAKQKFRRGNFFINTFNATKVFVKRLNDKFNF